MGCTVYTCRLLRAYRDTSVCRKCAGDDCNHRLAESLQAFGSSQSGGIRGTLNLNEFDGPSLNLYWLLDLHFIKFRAA